MSQTLARTMTRRQVLGLGLGTAMSLVAACAPSSSAPAPAKTESQPAEAAKPAASTPTTAPAVVSAAMPSELRLGFQPPYVAVWVMQRQKLLEEAFKASNTSIEFRKVLSPAPMYEALAGGSLDLGMGGPPIPAIAAGRPIRVVALTERSPKTHALLANPSGPIKAVEDLKGKRIATPLGKAYAFPLRALERAGLKDTDVEILTIENNEGRSALLTGSIDAWATWDPFYASVEADKQATKLVDGEGFYPNYVTLFGRVEFIEKYPEAVVRFMKVYAKALKWVNENKPDALKIFTEENQYKPEVADLTWARRNYLLDAPNDEFMNDIKDQAKMYVRLGVAQQEPNWDTAIDMKLAKQALGV
jgi:sulfonate transport system substrate-binding protein